MNMGEGGGGGGTWEHCIQGREGVCLTHGLPATTLRPYSRPPGALLLTLDMPPPYTARHENTKPAEFTNLHIARSNSHCRSGAATHIVGQVQQFTL